MPFSSRPANGGEKRARGFRAAILDGRFAVATGPDS